jgi:hypothetical protein
MSQVAPVDPPAPPTAIVARHGRYYRNARYIMALIMIGTGIWCAWNGYVTYPRDDQAEIDAVFARARENLAPGEELSAEKKSELAAGTKLPHGRLSIWLNQVLAVILPPAAGVLLFWTHYNSRGAYRLAQGTLHVPGHPPVPLSAIRRLDKTRWERKGIAWIEYELPDGRTGRLRLDDFVYDQEPTDQIMKEVDQYVLAQVGATAAPPAPPAGG